MPKSHTSQPVRKPATDNAMNTLSQPEKPAILQSWGKKLIVLLLCGMSFYAGWQAYHAHFVDRCLDSGGQVVQQQGLDNCQW